MLSVSISHKETKCSSTHDTESHCNSIHSKQMRKKDIDMYVVKQSKKNHPEKKGLRCSSCHLQHSVLTFLVPVNVAEHRELPSSQTHLNSWKGDGAPSLSMYGVMCPVPHSSEQERHGVPGAGPAESNKDD